MVMNGEVKGETLSAQDLKGPKDNKKLDDKGDEGADGTGKPKESNSDNKGGDKGETKSPEGLNDNPDLSYRGVKAKYVSLEKHKKMKEQRDKARTQRDKFQTDSELKNLKMDDKVIDTMAEKLGLDSAATREFANLIYKSGVDTATRIIKGKYGDKIKQIGVSNKNTKLTESFNKDFSNNLISVLEGDDKTLALSRKAELMELAFLEENLQKPLYNLFLEKIKPNNPGDSQPLEGGKKGGGKGEEVKKLEDMTSKEQNALSDRDWEKLDAERIAREKEEREENS